MKLDLLRTKPYGSYAACETARVRFCGAVRSQDLDTFELHAWRALSCKRHSSAVASKPEMLRTMSHGSPNSSTLRTPLLAILAIRKPRNELFAPRAQAKLSRGKKLVAGFADCPVYFWSHPLRVTWWPKWSGGTVEHLG